MTARELERTATAGDPLHAFVRPGQVAPDLPPPDQCVRCGAPEAAHGTGWPEDVGDGPIATPPAQAGDEDQCGATDEGWICTAALGHAGDYAAYALGAGLCHTWPQDPAAAPPVDLSVFGVKRDGSLVVLTCRDHKRCGSWRMLGLDGLVEAAGSHWRTFHAGGASRG